MRTFLGEVPVFALALMVMIPIALGLSSAVARQLGSSRWVAALLLLGFGLVISATLVPTATALEGITSSGGCDTSRIGLAPIEELTRVSATSLNVLLFVPLGIGVGLLPRTREAGVYALASFLLTFIVEGVQMLVPVLGRGCQTADIFDNLLGLLIGIGGGLLLRSIARP